MAMLFDLEAERDACFVGSAEADPADAAFDLIHDHIAGLDPRSALVRTRRYKARLAALETSSIARLNRETGSDHESKRALNDGKTSKKAINNATKRAEVAAKNADLIDKMDTGDLSEEHVDLIADTAAKTGGAAAVDDDFIDEVAGVDPDQAKNVADKFIAKHADPEGTQTEHDRQTP